jgi:hypothetical protein
MSMSMVGHGQTWTQEDSNPDTETVIDKWTFSDLDVRYEILVTGFILYPKCQTLLYQAQSTVRRGYRRGVLTYALVSLTHLRAYRKDHSMCRVLC